MYLNRHRLDLWTQANAGSGSAASNFLARTSGLDATHTTAYTTLLNGLTTDGFFSSRGTTLKLDALYVFATADTTTALLNLAQNAYNATATGGPTFTVDQGYVGSSTAFINSNFQVNLGTGFYAKDSAVVFAWIMTNTHDSSAIFSLVTPGNSISGYYSYDVTGHIQTQLNDATAPNLTATIADARGLWATNRSISTSKDVYNNGAFVETQSANSIALEALNIQAPGSSTAGASIARFSVLGFGGSISASDHANLYARVHTYLQTIAGVP